eukprot:4325551-Pleurochrysis_carterae.AAC.3
MAARWGDGQRVPMWRCRGRQRKTSRASERASIAPRCLRGAPASNALTLPHRRFDADASVDLPSPEM